MDSRSPQRHSRFFVLMFVTILVLLLASFSWFVRLARNTLPQESEVIALEEAVALIRTGAINRLLLQDNRDLFLYRHEEPRPLYLRLAAGADVTTTLQVNGVPFEAIPPLTVEE